MYDPQSISNLQQKLEENCAGNSQRGVVQAELPHEKRARMMKKMDSMRGQNTGNVVLPKKIGPPPPLEDGTIDEVDYASATIPEVQFYNDSGELVAGHDYPEEDDENIDMEQQEPETQVEAPVTERRRRKKHTSKPVTKVPESFIQPTEKNKEDSPNIEPVQVVTNTVEREHPVISSTNVMTREKLSSADAIQLQRLGKAIDWVTDIVTKDEFEEVTLSFPGIMTFTFPMVQLHKGNRSITLCLRMDSMQVVPEVGTVMELCVPSLDKDPFEVVYSGGYLAMDGLGVVFISFVMYDGSE